MHSLEAAFSELQRVDAKVRSDLDHRKQNLNSEENRLKELIKIMQEVSPLFMIFFLSTDVIKSRDRRFLLSLQS